MQNGLSILSIINFLYVFTKRPDYDVKADVFVQEQKLEVVHEFKYLGLLLDSQLSSKKTCEESVKYSEI